MNGLLVGYSMPLTGEPELTLHRLVGRTYMPVLEMPISQALMVADSGGFDQYIGLADKVRQMSCYNLMAA